MKDIHSQMRLMTMKNISLFCDNREHLQASFTKSTRKNSSILLTFQKRKKVEKSHFEVEKVKRKTTDVSEIDNKLKDIT